MKAIILAAGRGSRMKDLTDERPKCLIELNGKTLLDWQLESIREAGISEIGIVTGYKRELLLSYGLKEFHNTRWAETNMVNSLECAKEWLESDCCIVSYSDIFYSANAVRLLMTEKEGLAITYDPNWLELWTKRFGDPLLDAETFRITKENILCEIGNKPKSILEIQGQYMGLLRIGQNGWLEIERIRSILTAEKKDKMHMTGTLQLIINAGEVPIKAIPYIDRWGEVDSESDLIAYDKSIM